MRSTAVYAIDGGQSLWHVGHNLIASSRYESDPQSPQPVVQVGSSTPTTLVPVLSFETQLSVVPRPPGPSQPTLWIHCGNQATRSGFVLASKWAPAFSKRCTG